MCSVRSGLASLATVLLLVATACAGNGGDESASVEPGPEPAQPPPPELERSDDVGLKVLQEGSHTEDGVAVILVTDANADVADEAFVVRVATDPPGQNVRAEWNLDLLEGERRCHRRWRVEAVAVVERELELPIADC